MKLVTRKCKFVTMKFFKEMVCRCFTRDYKNLPIMVRSIGHYNLLQGNRDLVAKRHFLEFYWCINGIGEFVIDGKKHLLHPGEVCFYDFGDTHDLRAYSENFHYRWITFDGPMIREFWKNLGLTKKPRYAGTCPEELYCKAASEILDCTHDGLSRASALGITILMRGASTGHKTEKIEGYAAKAKYIIDMNYDDAEFNINLLAEQLHVNRSQLSRRFSKDFGITLSKYLINQRIQRGVQLISTTNTQLKEIAVKSGFADPSYFFRCIKKYTGSTPVELRGKNNK